ncbi:Mpo1-like protein [Lysobacter sp. A378]
MNKSTRYRNFAEFYPFYLSEHSHPVSRGLHFVGTSISLLLLVAALVTQVWWLLLVALVQAYAFAWAGHFIFERNRPATFQYPLLSFLGDWRMWWDMLTGKLRP